jgi:hypothetical protein
MGRIASFEALAEKLVEGTFARLFADRLSPLEVATHLTRAIEDNHTVSVEGIPQAPTHYWIYLNPEDCDALAVEQPHLESELAHHVGELAAQAGLTTAGAPVVRVLPRREVRSRQVRVKAKWMPEDMPQKGETREMDAAEATVARECRTPPGRPFLILEGRRHVNLLEPVISVGRALDNDLILEDPRVSRRHAQLRRRYGRYVLYDLDSAGGTTINGYPVEECVLHSGDVVSFAGVSVIYGEDPPTPIPASEAEKGNTPVYPSQHQGSPAD